MFDLLFRGRRVVFNSTLPFDEITTRLQRDVVAPGWRRTVRNASKARLPAAAGTEARTSTRLLAELFEIRTGSQVTECSMRYIATVLLMFTCLIALPAAQGSSGGTVKACSLLPRELVAKVSSMDKQLLNVLKPSEQPLGSTGSACTYAGITLQVDPFQPARLEEMRKQTGKDWVATPGVGDSAYFRDNGGRYAELYARTASHVFTIQMTVPESSTVVGIKPKMMTLAADIAQKLR